MIVNKMVAKTTYLEIYSFCMLLDRPMNFEPIFLVKSFFGNFYRHLAIFFWAHCPQTINGT